MSDTSHGRRLALLLGILMAALPALASTYYVRQGGNDRADGLSPATAFRSLVRAGQVLNHADQVVVGPGTYRETVFIADRFGTPAARVAITGDESGKLTGDLAGAVVIVPTTAAEPALLFRHCERVTLTGLTLRGPGIGVGFEKCRDVVVQRSTFDGLSSGLCCKGVEGLVVESCVFARCVIGASLKTTSSTRVEHITAASCSAAGLLLSACGPGTIRNAIFAQNISAFITDEVSAQNWTSDYNAISGGVGPWGDVPGLGFAYQWPSASGQDRHSLYLTPTFAGPERYDLHINPAVSWAGGLPGMYAGTAPARKAVLDRDSKPFLAREGAVSVGAYDYPPPVPGAGWRQLSATLKGSGPRQSAGIYLADGSLVRMLLADVTGVRELWWDGRDDLGQPAPAGKYEIRSVGHDVRLVDDGAVGNNGNASGFFHPYCPFRAAPLPDGGFLLCGLDEHGTSMRRYSATGQPLCASFYKSKDFWGLTCAGSEIIGGYIAPGKTPDPATARLVRLNTEGTRALMATGAQEYPIFAPGEQGGLPAGVAVVGHTAYVSVPALNIVRLIDLQNGKPLADWPLVGIGEITADEQGRLWALMGPAVVSLDTSGKVVQHYPTTLNAPKTIAAGGGQVAVLDADAGRVTVLDSATGKVIRTFGESSAAGEWKPLSLETLRYPKGLTVLAGGQLLLLEMHRIRACWPDSGKICFDESSLFAGPVVVHPTRKEYCYSNEGIFRADPTTGAWTWVAEMPALTKPSDADILKIPATPYGAAVLNGRPFLLYAGNRKQALKLVDVSDPLKPRIALAQDDFAVKNINATYCSFGPNGDLLAHGSGNPSSLEVARIKFQGLDAQQNPIYDFAHPVILGPKVDPTARKLQWTWGGEHRLAADPRSGEVYHLANTALHPVTVAYFRGATGVAKSGADGKPLWYVNGRDSFYMGMDCVDDGKRTWVMAGDWFVGGPDVFDSDGLCITSGNLGWPSSYAGGMMDIPSAAVAAYLRADGKVGVNVEDDSNGRSIRFRMDGAETLRKKTMPLEWKMAATTAGLAPSPQTPGGQQLPYLLIPNVAPLAIDGDWNAWRKAGGVAQILNLPCNVSFNRGVPENLLLSLADCTSIGGLVHDDKNFYAYFLVADETPHADAPKSGDIYAYDGIEFFLEQEQFSMGLLKDGTPDLYKHRQHNRDKTDYGGRYSMPREDVWASPIDDLGAHPLGQELAAITGISMRGKKGYAVMAKIPFEEIKLVGGAGHKAGINDMTGVPGEVVRVIVSQACIFNWGAYQEAKICWPPSQMFFDANRSIPMELGK